MIVPEFNGIGAISQSNSYAGHQILCLYMYKRYCLRRVFRESWCKNRNMHVSVVVGQAGEFNWSSFTRSFSGRVSTNISLSCQVCSLYRCLNWKILILRKTKQKHHPTLHPSTRLIFVKYWGSISMRLIPRLTAEFSEFYHRGYQQLHKSRTLVCQSTKHKQFRMLN